MRKSAFTSETAADFGRRGGSTITPATRRASRRNGRKHGRKVRALFSHESVEWPTPAETYAALDAEFGFTLDPCATPESAKCARFYTRDDDGLAQPWSGSVFMNPPYGVAIGRWMAKAWEEARRGALVVCLVPARTDTRWWHDYAARGEVRFLRGRLRFGAGRYSAPFPSAVVVFRPTPPPT